MYEAEKMRQTIDRRVSVRKYTEDISEENREWIRAVPQHFRHISENSRFSVFPLDEVKGFAPSHLAVCVEGTEENFEEAGFIGEQLVLALTAEGFGTCWIGMPGPMKAAEKEMKRKRLERKPLVLIACGKPEGRVRMPLRKSRVPVESFAQGEITDLWQDALDCVRQAPSATNSQPWKVAIQGNRADLYLSPWSVASKLFLGTMNRIDMGIALAHLVIGMEAKGHRVKIFRDQATAVPVAKASYKWSIAVE